ncbi:hypothetical protein N9B94_02720, partial [Verrucomicrobia bacterium]|nr:hypothetical protein [Verrucomicrobiota bacterium]
MNFIVAPEPGQHQRFSLTWTEVPSGRHLLTVRATDSDGASSHSRPVLIYVRAGNAPSLVSIHARDHKAAEGSEPLNDAVFRVARRGGLEAPLTVTLAIGGSAENGVDYDTLSTSLNFAVDEAFKDLTVRVIDDSIQEHRETVVVGLRYPQGRDEANIPEESELATLPYEIGRERRAVAVIRDDDRPESDVRPSLGNGAVSRLIGDRLVELVIAGVDGDSVVVEISDDFEEWLPIGEAIVTDGVINFIDPDSRDRLRGFYRFRNKNDLPVIQQGTVN